MAKAEREQRYIARGRCTSKTLEKFVTSEKQPETQATVS